MLAYIRTWTTITTALNSKSDIFEQYISDGKSWQLLGVSFDVSVYTADIYER